MPPAGRALRQRLTVEHDENSVASRVTRAKASALNVDELAVPAKPQTKVLGSNAQAGQRKRAALGDVSNVATKTEINDGKKAAGVKKIVGGKKVVAKTAPLFKAAQPTGVQKNTTRASARPALATQESNKKVEKRTGAGSITTQKRRVASSTSTINDTATEDVKVVEKKTVKSENKHEEEQAVVPKDSPFKFPPGVRNLEDEDLDDPLMVAEYAVEIFEYLRDLEVKSTPNPHYMTLQDDLEWKTRGILVDWLIEVHTRFHLLPETLFLAVNIIDRFLSEKIVQLERLQLVGITAMFIASKYEEVLSPHVNNFVHVADDGFTDAEILSAERFILSTLDYDLSYPNPMNFLRRISKADNYEIQSRTIGKYLTEISLLDHRFMAFRPSHVAAAAMYLSRMILDRGEWDETIAFYAGYTELEIEPVFQLMVDYLARPVVHEAFFKKYASKKFLKASILCRQWAKTNAVHFGVVDTHLSIDQI